ncbi:MAG: hypothetical protein MJZ37_07590, partial [Bacilli bacterium]|nr:hypothetical protein [Bacilli bacterium]
MLKLDENYSDYVDMDNPDYPEGAAKNASSSESYDGTPLLASFMNNVIGGMQAMWKKAFGSTTGITGSADTVNESQFANAVEKFVNDKVEDHADLRGENAHGAKSSADPGQLVTRDEYGNAKFGVPLANDDAARRGDIYDLTKGVLCMTEATVFAKEIPVGKFPGFELNDEIIVKVLFQSGCEKDTSSYNSSTDIFTLNFCNTGNKKVYVKRNGAIKLFEKHNIGTKTKVFQSYTEMELMYLTSLDNGSGGWLVLNNPIVLSNTGTQEYTIYADGSTTLDAAYPVDSYYEQLPGFFSPNDKWGAISVWQAVQMGGVFFRSEGSNALPFTGALKCTVSGTTISLASDAETRGYESTLASITATDLIVVVGDQQRAVTAWNRTNHTITIASAFSSSNITNVLIGECDSNKSHNHTT